MTLKEVQQLRPGNLVLEGRLIVLVLRVEVMMLFFLVVRGEGALERGNEFACYYDSTYWEDTKRIA